MNFKKSCVLLTGATGFIGQAIQKHILRNAQYDLTVSSRRPGDITLGINTVVVPDISVKTDWAVALQGIDLIIHAAARAHVLKDETEDPLAEYRKVNVDGTVNLAKQAAIAGVKRFVFLSSIGVNGNINTSPFTADDEVKPAEPYALSKWEAEQGLKKIAEETELEIVIIRPPLVYGANAPGNFESLVRWVDKGIPLPLGAINNKRSLVGLDNLVDLIMTCLEHPAATNQVFLAGDGEDLSTSDLLRAVAQAMEKPARLLPVPANLLLLGASLLGKKAMAQRLLGSLQVDITKTRELLGWCPPFTVEQGLARCFNLEKNT